jgi:hypothetical protein
MAETSPSSPAKGCGTLLALVVAGILAIWLGQWLHHTIAAMKERAALRRMERLGGPSAGACHRVLNSTRQT